MHTSWGFFVNRLIKEREKAAETEERHRNEAANLLRETKTQQQRHVQQQQQLQERLAAITTELNAVKIKTETEPSRLQLQLQETAEEAA